MKNYVKKLAAALMSLTLFAAAVPSSASLGTVYYTETGGICHPFGLPFYFFDSE